MMAALPSLKSAARRAGLGPVLLNCYFKPVGLVRNSIAEGGPLQQRRTELGRRAMVEAAAHLPPLDAPEIDNGATVAFVSGARYWHQTIFCFASLQLHSPIRITPVIFDDGTLDQRLRTAISRVVPWARYVGADEIEKKLDKYLPEARFPRLRARRREYPHLRKLTDIHVAAWGWTLVFDSDMLVFRRPEALLDWFQRPRCIYMQDVATSYGYPAHYLRDLSDCDVPERVNVGLYALNGPTIAWEAVEHWCSRQLDDYGPSYLQEQALTALIIAQGIRKPLCDRDYRVLPDLGEGKNPTAVIHHYVAHSKRAYYQFAWRRVECQLRTFGFK